MSDLISRQAAKVSITRYFEVHVRNQKSRRLKEHAEEICRDICFGIDAWPSAQPEKGKWIRDGHHIRCDQCGMCMCDTDREGDRIPTEFCPNCGAKMGQEGGR